MSLRKRSWLEIFCHNFVALKGTNIPGAVSLTLLLILLSASSFPLQSSSFRPSGSTVLLVLNNSPRGGKSSRPSQRKRKYDISYTIQNEVTKKKESGTNASSRNVDYREKESGTHASSRNVDYREDNESGLKVQRKPDLRTQLNYARNGHAVIRQLLPVEQLQIIRRILVKHGQTQELAAWRQKVQVAADRDPVKSAQLAASCQTVQDCKEQLRQLLDVDEVSLPFLQYFNTWRTYPQVYDVAQALAETAAVIMDVRSVRLYQDAVFWKRVGDGPTPWHTDARMAPFDTSHMITFWIPLQPVKQSGLIFCSKSQADFALPYWNDVALSKGDTYSPWNNLDERYSALPCVHHMPMNVGDVTVHSGWTLHCANEAIDENRIALAITFVDSRGPIRIDAVPNANSKGDREDVWSYEDWVQQVPCNAPFDHPLVPILWPPRDKKIRKK
jgi:ectoine hydroxylase-related dioxygenase (phytanoyl-CoA dioxygenase family)